MKNLIGLLLDYEEAENERVIIEQRTFQQILLYILMEEVLVMPPKDKDETLYSQEIFNIQKEFEEILHLLKRID